MGIGLRPESGCQPGLARRLVVVHDPRQNDGLINLPREAAKAQSQELLALEAEDSPGLPMVLRESWRWSRMVFSCNAMPDLVFPGQ